MHFEILTEDASGKIVLELIMEKLVGPYGDPHTYKIISYKGLGHIPKNLKDSKGVGKRILLQRLPALLKGYGKSQQYFPAVIIVVLDLDNRDRGVFLQELEAVLHTANPEPETLFRFAIEEGEAWLLGDRAAVRAAYPKAKAQVLANYVQDSICGTWETLADAIHPGGAQDLKDKGWPHTGQAKCEWAKKIAPHMNAEGNQSPSFQEFRDGIASLAE